jgi:pimeloyl-ACP methyl ester carboxylesterase
MKKWTKRIALGFVGLLVATIGAGSAYEAIGRALAFRNYPPEGKLVDIGNRRIQLDCRGAGSPTVVFESGLDHFGSLAWSAVHDDVAHTTRACAYSRAGILWSDPAPGGQDGKTVVADLHAALERAGERPPFVLVAHSLGGPYALIYARDYSTEVAGLVFVDASHPEQTERLNAVVPSNVSAELPVLKVMNALSWTGVIHLFFEFYPPLPHEPEAVARAAAAYESRSFGGALKELESMDATLAEARTARSLGDRPLFVLTATAPLTEQQLKSLKITPEQGHRVQELWKAMQDEEASWSSRSRHELVPDSQHYIQFDRPDLVVAATRWVVETVRGRPSGTT